MIHAVLFEIEGVLIDTDPAWRAALGGALASLGVAVDEQAVAAGGGVPIRQRVRHLLATRDVDETTHDLVVLDTLRRFSIGSRQGSSIRPGARELLEEARVETRVASVTELRRQDAEALLELAGVAELVEFVIAADDAPVSEPGARHRRALTRLAHRGAVEAGRVLALEGIPDGAHAARAVGLSCLLIGEQHVGGEDETIVVPNLAGHDLRSLWDLAAPRTVRAR